MKKFFLFFLFINLLSASKTIILAQDVILLHNRDSIQAKVIEVTDQTISYKMFNYQDGPTIVLNKNQVNYILWQTGEKMICSTEKTPFTSSIETKNLPYIKHIQGSNFYLENDSIISKTDFFYLLQKHQLGLYEYAYNEGSKKVYTGFGFLGGSLLLGVGTIAVFSYLTTNGSLGDIFIAYPILVTGIGIALGFGIASIPLIINGNKKRQHAIDDYNKLIRPGIEQAQGVSLHFGTTSSGLGLTLKF